MVLLFVLKGRSDEGILRNMGVSPGKISCYEIRSCGGEKILTSTALQDITVLIVPVVIYDRRDVLTSIRRSAKLKIPFCARIRYPRDVLIVTHDPNTLHAHNHMLQYMAV